MSDIDPTPSTPVTIGDRLGWWRGELRADLAAQHQALLDAQAAQHQALLDALATQHQALLDALAATLVGTGGATEATQAAILAAIGQLDTYPSGWTVRALLAQLATFIDSEPGEPPSNVLPDPGGCGSLSWDYEGLVSFVSTGQQTSVGGNLCDIYAMTAFAVADRLTVADDWVFEIDPSFAAAHPNGFISFCVAWDYTGSAVYQQGPHQSDSVSVAATPWTWIVPTTQGSRADELHPTGQAKRYLAWYFAVPAGNPMPPSVYVHVLGQWIS